MKEHKPRFISIARINAKIEAFTNGVKPQDLDAEADKIEGRITDKKGRQSESNFAKTVSGTPTSGSYSANRYMEEKCCPWKSKVRILVYMRLKMAKISKETN